MASDSRDPPTHITGGCLCGSVRFTITFGEETGLHWPPNVDTCQCTMCRKFTGAVVPTSITIPAKSISPPLASNPTFQRYHSGPPHCSRGFCSRCGSPLTFSDAQKPDLDEIWIGLIDEEWLCGEKVPGSERQTEHGVVFERKGGWGHVLARPVWFGWMENAIKGVTDVGKGRKWLTWRIGEGWE